MSLLGFHASAGPEFKYCLPISPRQSKVYCIGTGGRIRWQNCLYTSSVIFPSLNAFSAKPCNSFRSALGVRATLGLNALEAPGFGRPLCFEVIQLSLSRLYLRDWELRFVVAGCKAHKGFKHKNPQAPHPEPQTENISIQGTGRSSKASSLVFRRRGSACGYLLQNPG